MAQFADLRKQDVDGQGQDQQAEDRLELDRRQVALVLHPLDPSLHQVSRDQSMYVDEALSTSRSSSSTTSASANTVRFPPDRT